MRYLEKAQGLPSVTPRHRQWYTGIRLPVVCLTCNHLTPYNVYKLIMPQIDKKLKSCRLLRAA